MKTAWIGYTRGVAGLALWSALPLSAGWTEINAGLTRAAVGVRALVIAPATTSTIYAVGIIDGPWSGWGSLFKTTDGGATWNTVSGISSSVAALAVDPGDSSRLYAVAAGIVLKSADEGQSWIAASAGLSQAYTLAIDPRNTSTLYAAAYSGGIFKTTDGAANWTSKSPATGCRGGQIVFDPSDASVIYFGGGDHICKSTDGGETWRVLRVGGSGCDCPLAIDPARPSVLYTMRLRYDLGSPIWSVDKSTDGGESWRPANAGIPSGSHVTSLVIDASTDTIYASYIVGDPTGGVVKSTDGGASWNTVNTGFPENTPPIYSLALDPLNPATIMAGYFDVHSGRGGVFKTTDGAKNWNDSSAGLTVINVNALAIDPVDRATAYSTVGDSLAKYVNGVEWTTLYHAPGSSVGATVLSSFLIDPHDPKILYVAAQGTAGCFSNRWLRKSIDGGATWTELRLQSFCGFGAGLAFDSDDSNTIYATAQDPDDCGSPFEGSRDAGATWSLNILDYWIGPLVAVPGDQTTLFAGTGRGVKKSTDGGRTWSDTGLADGYVPVLAAEPRDSNILYAAVEGDWFQSGVKLGLFKTTDGGATWSPARKGLPDTGPSAPVTALAIDSNFSVLYLGTSGSGVFKSVDGGVNWTAFNDGLTNLDIRALAASSDGSGTVYAGTRGGIFRVVDTQ